MKMDVYDKVAKLQEATTLKEIEAIFENIIHSYGFDQFGVQYTPAEIKSNPELKPYSLSTYRREWVDYYIDQNYHHIDPIITEGVKQRRPFFWDSLLKGIEITRRQKSFFNEAADNGASFGVGIPIPLLGADPCMVTFMSSWCTDKEVRQIMKEEHLELSLIAAHFQTAISKIFENLPPKGAPILTPREQEILKWLAEFKTDWEIGHILNINKRTVEHHVQNICRKFDCVFRAQAVVKAIRMKLIKF